MKSTDTILGAFGVLGIVLLGVVVASSMDTTDREIDPLVVDESSEVLLNPSETESDQAEVVVTNQESNEIILGSKNENFDLSKWQDYGITNQELLALIDSSDNRISFNNVDQSIITELENLIGNNHESEQYKFKQQNSDEIKLGSNVEKETVVSINDQVNKEIINEPAEITPVDVDSQTDDVDQVSQLEGERSRISAFFDNFFGGNDQNNNDGRDIGGTNEDSSVDSSVGGNDDESDLISDNRDDDQEQLVVRNGDSVWEILINQGLSQGQVADVINDMRTDSSMAKNFGITSGSVDLIYPGQVLNLSVL